MRNWLFPRLVFSRPAIASWYCDARRDLGTDVGGGMKGIDSEGRLNASTDVSVSAVEAV